MSFHRYLAPEPTSSSGAEDLAPCFATRSLDNASVNIIILGWLLLFGLVDKEKFCFFSILYNFLFWDGRNILVNMTSKWIERSVTPNLHLSSLRYVFGNRPFPVAGLEHNQHKIKAFYPLLGQLVCSTSTQGAARGHAFDPEWTCHTSPFPSGFCVFGLKLVQQIAPVVLGAFSLCDIIINEWVWRERKWISYKIQC